MKRIFCIIMAFSVALASVYSCANAYEKTSYNDQSMSSEAINYLKMMQIADVQNPAQPLTRSDAVVAIIKSMGFYDMALSASIEYYTNEQKAAYFAHQIGILSSPEPDGWNLSGNVTLAQAAKMLVVALGYNASVDPQNAYPVGYLSKAAGLGLLDDISVSDSEQSLSGEDFVTMLYHAMNTSVMEMSGIYGDGVTYTIDENTTLESVYLNRKGWKTGEGLVSHDSFGSLYPNTEVKKDTISVDGTEFKNTIPSNNGYVGYRVKYVVTDTTERDSELIGMMITNDNTSITLTSNDEPYLDGTTVYYYGESNTKEEKLSLASGVIFMINGTLSQNFTLSNIDFSDGDFEFIDNNGDKNYDIVKCDYSKSFIVNFVKDDIIYLKNGIIHSKSVVDLSDTELVSYSIRDIDGNTLAISDIAADDGITVIASEDFSYVDIIKLPAPVNITVTEGSDDKVMADGIWYTVGDISLTLTPGQGYTVRVNEKGEIYHATQEYHGCVYVMDKGRNTDGINKSVLLKIYDIKTGINTFTAASKVSIDGIAYTNDDEIHASIPTGTLINLDTNSNGEFTKITSLEKYGEKAVRIYCKYVSAFNDTAGAESVPFRFDENTVFFTVPENGDDYDYGVDVELKDNYEYTTQAYEFDEETGAVKAAVITVQTDMKTNLTYKADVGVISAISQVSLPDGEATYKISLFDDGEQHIYHAGQYDDVFRVCYGLGIGDVVRYIVNYSDEIVAIERITELSKVSTGFNNGKNTADEQIFGQALSLDKNIITNNSKYLYHKLGVSPNTSFSNITLMEFFAHTENTADANCEYNDYYLFDKRTETVKAVTVDDIITYEMAGDSASWIFVQKSYTDVQCIVIVK